MTDLYQAVLDDRDRLLDEIERYQDFRAEAGDLAQGPAHNDRGG